MNEDYLVVPVCLVKNNTMFTLKQASDRFPKYLYILVFITGGLIHFFSTVYDNHMCAGDFRYPSVGIFYVDCNHWFLQNPKKISPPFHPSAASRNLNPEFKS